LLNARAFISERIKNKDAEIFAAESDDGILTGFVQLYPIFSSTNMKRLWLLNDLFVNPNYRGQHIGVLLIERAKKLAKETSSAGLMLETSKTNLIGNKLYPKTDFVLDEDHNYYNWSV
jgi:GNAT superfamily N-acetyltransferase